MFLVYLWNYIRGYVIIVVTGKSIERFINICSRRQILLWDIERKDSESAVMKASLRGFRHMRPAARKSACRVRILKRCGLPFVFARLKKRRGFKIGFAIFLLLFLLSSSIIWDIEVTGCKPEVVPEIMSILENEKIKRGRFKMGLDPRKLAQEIVMQVDGVAWAGVEIKGVKLTVSIEDSVSVPKLIQNNQPYNIVAERDGLIIKMEVYAGNPLVKEGDTVRKGQLLVSGRLQNQRPDLGGDFNTKDVHALGKIIARTWYENSLPISMEYTQKVRTGKEHKTVYLRIFDEKIRLPGKKLTFEMYETATYDKILKGPFGIKLPIGVTIEKSFEIVEKKKGLTLEEAKSIAEETCRQQLSKRLPPDSRVVDEKVNFVESGNGQMYVQVVVECEEDIAGFEPVIE